MTNHKNSMDPKDVYQWFLIGAMLLAAGIWLGKLQSQVNNAERMDHYLHGDVVVPKE